MKTTILILAAMICGSLFNSCVSTRKYKDAEANWEKKHNNLQSQYDELQKEKKRLQASTSDELRKKQEELYKKEKELLEREAKIQEMKGLVNEQSYAIRNLKKEVCSALKCFTPDELTIEVRDGKLYVSMSEMLLFPSGSDKVNERGIEAIGMLASVVAKSNLEIMVEGHTDPVPINTVRNKDNWDLSVHRATSVTRILIDDGIAAERIIASGRGEFHPLEDNESAEGRQINRRTEIVLSPKLDKLWKLAEEEDDNGKAMLNKK